MGFEEQFGFAAQAQQAQTSENQVGLAPQTPAQHSVAQGFPQVGNPTQFTAPVGWSTNNGANTGTSSPQSSPKSSPQNSAQGTTQNTGAVNSAEAPPVRIGVAGKLMICGAALVLLAILSYVVILRLSGPKQQQEANQTDRPQQSEPSQQPSPTQQPTASPTPSQPSVGNGSSWRVIANTDGFVFKETGEALFVVQGVRLYADTSGGGIQVRHVAYGTVSGDAGGAVYEVEIPRSSKQIDAIAPGFTFTIRFDLFVKEDGTASFIENLRP